MATITHPTSFIRIRRRRSLATALDGKLLIPEHAAYAHASLAWNLAIEQRPAAVVLPESADDVAAAVLFAREHGLRVAAQGTGHNPGPLGSLEDTVLIKTERMRRVQIDPAARVARVEAGVLWQEVVEAAAPYGLGSLQGSSPDVGVVGYTIGGGASFMGRRYGLAANMVKAVELVTADGRLVRADRENEPDLFWALRGGGGSFGVVTAIELELFCISGIYAGILWYPVERAGEVLHAWRELTQSRLPDELTTVGRILHFPPIPEVPEPVRGQSFATVEAYHVGDPATADQLLAPLRALGPVNDTIATISMPALSGVHMDPDHPAPNGGDGLMLAKLPADAVDEWVTVAGAETKFPLLSVQLRHLEGEFARARPENGALASIDAKYAMYANGVAATPELATAIHTQVEEVKRTFAPYAARHMYLNFAETNRPADTFWTEHAYRRLQRIKADVDPDNIIRANHPIPPAR
jgi:FAD binding domain-containing protein/berberine-like enzyme